MTDDPLLSLERLVIGAVGVTAVSVAQAAPDLTLVQWRVVVVLAATEDGMTVTELAQRLGSRLPATSRMLSRMRQREIVETRKDHADGRVTTALLTDAGRDLWRRVVERRRADLRDALAKAVLDRRETAAVSRLGAALELFA